MKNIVISFFLALLIIGFLPINVLAQATSIPVSTPSAITSFELFWPISAGKTLGESSYFLKSLKEKMRGFIIFGAGEKADYSVFLATKRVVEAEKLILENKFDLSEKTLVLATEQINKAGANVDKLISGKISFQEQAVNMTNRLSNLEIFIPELILKADKNREVLNELLNKISSLKTKLL